ncbi:MAG: hypothetical protein LUF28_10490 [Clostridiales bacterium]|nr:hypothetical protein [Clostridiales bacterium]
MKQPPESPLTFVMTSWEKTFQEDGEAVLTACAALPIFSGGTAQARSRLNRFYRHMEARFRRRAARLARQAGAERAAARSRSRWFSSWQWSLSAQVRQAGDTLEVAWQVEDSRGKILSGAEGWHLPEGWIGAVSF